MESLFLLIPLALMLAVLIGIAFWWSVSAGQFEGLEEAGRALIDDSDNPDRPT
jgi:cbb3-type cytochrome oxidase maturation protein